MEHEKFVDKVKAQRTIASEAFSEISRLKSEAFDAVQVEREQIKQQKADLEARVKAEKRALKEQADALRVSESEIFKA